jgi:hypothetical protein
LVLTGGHADAGEANDSEALINRGLELRQAGQDRQALPLFQEAAEKKKTPRALAQVGMCEYALGLWVEAEEHMQQALASRTDAWIHKNERNLKEALGEIQEKLGSIDVWGEPSGARVAVDGHAMGMLPLEHPLRLTTGRHSLLIEAAGFLTDTRFVEIKMRVLTREHVALGPLPVLTPPPQSTQPAGTLVSTGAALGGPSAGNTASSSPSSEPIYTRWWFWTALGAVAVAAGGTALVLSRKERCDSSGGGPCVVWQM